MKLIVTLTLTVLLSSCFLNPFAKGEKSELEVRDWPKGKNFRMAFSHKRLICDHDTHEITVESRTNCQGLVSGWEPLFWRDGVMEDDYMVTNGACPTCPDTITVMVQNLIKFNGAEDCIWLFRARVKENDKYSKWQELPFGLKLTEHDGHSTNFGRVDLGEHRERLLNLSAPAPENGGGSRLHFSLK